MDERGRKEAEIRHGKKLAESPGVVWERSTIAGQKRLENRFADLMRYFGSSPRGRVLELGCGMGSWTRLLSRLPWRITSMDISEDLLRRAQETISRDNVEFRLGDGERVPFENESFDYVCGLSILHHMDLRKAAAEIFRILKPGGKTWFSEPNMLNPQIMLQKNIPILKRWAGDTPDETAFFRGPFQKAFERAGFRIVSVTPIDFLHPLIPAFAVPLAARLNEHLERMPVLREIAGSLQLHAEK